MNTLLGQTLSVCLFAGLATAASAQSTINFSDIDRLQSSGSGWNFSSSPAGDDLLVGKGSTGTQFQTIITFDIASFATLIDSASSISFSIDYDNVNGGGVDLEAIGFGKTAGDVVASDGTTSGTSAGTILAGDFSAPGTATYDVTTIVQSITDDFVAFRLTTDFGAAGNSEFVRFGNRATVTSDAAQLVIVPEPGAFALLAGCAGLAFVALRRRR